jgi:GT2 family glycosyltransferase
METVIVDNNSPDQTRELARSAAGWARVVLGDHNIGFGRGCNRGLAEVRTPYVVFYNPDAQFTPESAAAASAFLDAHPKCAIAGPAIAHGDGSDEHAELNHVGGLATPSLLIGDACGLHSSYKRRTNLKPGMQPFQTDWVSGAMLMGRTDVLRQLGGFDPRFFLYWEETDLCRRALDAGHEIWCAPHVRASHVGGTSAAEESADRIKGCIPVHYYQSRYYYLCKHFGTFSAWTTDFLEYAIEPAVSTLRSLLGKAKHPLRRLKYPVWKMPRTASEVAPLGAQGTILENSPNHAT